jgi:cation:H+ antiporter
VGLFGVQVTLAFIFRNDDARTIATLTWLAWAYLALAGVLFLINARQLGAILRAAFVSPSGAIRAASLPGETPAVDRLSG